MKKFKAFTLIECLVALLILGVSSLLLVQGYTQLMKVTNKNNTMYVSLADQMNDVEKKDSSVAKPIGSVVSGDTYNATQGHDFVLKKATYNSSTNNYAELTGSDKRDYKTNVTVVANYSYQYHSALTSDEKDSGKGTDYRYIYFYR